MPPVARLTILVIVFSCNVGFGYSQCIVEKGPPPESYRFKTGGRPAGSEDLLWMVAADSINAEYRPAIVMDSLPSIFYSSSDWISVANPGEHTGDRLFYFKAAVELPCRNLCDVSYSEPNTFCLNFDIYVDNSIFEIYVNGVPQSDHLEDIPMDDPFNPDNHSPNTPLPVSLCTNWKPGRNEIVIVVASSAPILGLMIMESKIPAFPPGTDTLEVAICSGESYFFNNQQLTESGLYWYRYTNPSGCDSMKVLDLEVKPVPTTVVNTTICEGQTYEGYTTSGTYHDRFPVSTGCDSIRILQLTVKKTPQPDLGTITALCEGDSLILSPGTFINYLWQDGSSNNRFTVTRPGIYAVQVSNGCYSARAEVAIEDGLCELIFPNAFTPNGDGKNELFMMKTDAMVNDYRLSVFNRWGQKLFETNDAGRGWDGKVNGILQPAGVYAWTCWLNKSGKTVSRSGTVVMYR